MAGTKISNLPAANTPLNGTELVPVVQSGVTSRTTVAQVNTVIAAGSTEPRTLSDRFADPTNIKDFGASGDGVTNDAAALVAALATGKQVYVPKGSYFSLDAAQAKVFVENLGRVAPEEATIFNLPGEEISISTFVDVYNPDAIKIRVVGQNVASVGVTAVASAGGASKNLSITYTLSNAANVSVGDYILVTSSVGTGNHRVVEGCFKVTAKSGNDVTVKHTMNAAWPSAAFTFTSATCYPIKTVLRWPINSAGLRIGASFGELRNLVIAGSFDISSGSASDSPGDGLQVGTAPNTLATGLNESEQLNTGAVWASRVGFVEWQGNGVQTAGGHFYGTNVSACSNGWRGFQASRAGSVEAKFSSAVGNGSSGYEAEAEGWMNADASVATGNQQQGYYAIGSGTILAGRSHALYNQTGIDVRNYAIALGDQAYVRNNSLYGLYSVAGFLLFGNTSSAADNGTYDAFVVEGGIVNANGATSIGTKSIQHTSGSRFIDVDGTLVYPSAAYLENADGEQVQFNVTSVTDLTIGFDTTGAGSFSPGLVLRPSGVVYPSADGSADLGRSTNRWATVYAATGTVNTSDAREKCDVDVIGDAERRIALKLKSSMRKFRFKDAVTIKGEKARIHFGVLAQDVAAAFVEEGLDPNRYAMFCYDEWEETEEQRDEDGNIVVPFSPPGDRYGVRYNELFAFILAAT